MMSLRLIESSQVKCFYGSIYQSDRYLKQISTKCQHNFFFAVAVVKFCVIKARWSARTKRKKNADKRYTGREGGRTTAQHVNYNGCAFVLSIS